MVYQNIVRTFANVNPSWRKDNKTLNDYQGYGTRYITSEIPTITDYFLFHLRQQRLQGFRLFDKQQTQDIGFKQCSPIEVSRSYIKLLLYTNICLIR